jgi:hypothetical protein
VLVEGISARDASSLAAMLLPAQLPLAQQLAVMGYPVVKCVRAARRHDDVNAAVAWLESEEADA